MKERERENSALKEGRQTFAVLFVRVRAEKEE